MTSAFRGGNGAVNEKRWSQNFLQTGTSRPGVSFSNIKQQDRGVVSLILALHACVWPHFLNWQTHVTFSRFICVSLTVWVIFHIAKSFHVCVCARFSLPYHNKTVVRRKGLWARSSAATSKRDTTSDEELNGKGENRKLPSQSVLSGLTKCHHLLHHNHSWGCGNGLLWANVFFSLILKGL